MKRMVLFKLDSLPRVTLPPIAPNQAGHRWLDEEGHEINAYKCRPSAAPTLDQVVNGTKDQPAPFWLCCIKNGQLRQPQRQTGSTWTSNESDFLLELALEQLWLVIMRKAPDARTNRP